MPGRIHNPISLIVNEVLSLSKGEMLRPGIYQGWQRTSGLANQHIAYEVTLDEETVEVTGSTLRLPNRAWDVTDEVGRGLIKVGPARRAAQCG